MSADLVTGFLNNQYPTMSDGDGPLYSNLVVKEFRPFMAAEPTPTPAPASSNSRRYRKIIPTRSISPRG